MSDKRKGLKISVAEEVSVKDSYATVVSTVQPQNEKPIIKRFSLNNSSQDIVEEAIRDLEKAGYRLEPKKLEVLRKSVDDVRDLGVGFKVGGHLSIGAGGGLDLKKRPRKQKGRLVEEQVYISFEVVKEQD